MVDYQLMRKKYAREVSQTLGSPITFMHGTWELIDVMGALAGILIFGVVLSSWLLMLLSLAMFLWVLPTVKKKYPKGMLFHWPYRYFGLTLPGLLNPGENKKYSD